MKTIERRFWSKVDKRGPNERWLWTGTKKQPRPNSQGRYGVFYLDSYEGAPRVAAHRFAWVLANGREPGKLYVCHRCDNPPCVNPAHLFLGTHADNMRDMAEKGRQSVPVHRPPVMRGEEHPAAKLSAPVVEDARRRVANGETVTAVAASLGMSRSAVGAAVRGDTWRSVVARLVRPPAVAAANDHEHAPGDDDSCAACVKNGGAA